MAAISMTMGKLIAVILVTVLISSAVAAGISIMIPGPEGPQGPQGVQGETGATGARALSC